MAVSAEACHTFGFADFNGFRGMLSERIKAGNSSLMDSAG
jgi:hypothetical protein